ncbi:hypothetical protein [Alteribacillus iranensis]|nr:hypothetical protein [Alteribacillus iranensis]
MHGVTSSFSSQSLGCPQDVGQFDVVTGTSARGGGFYVAHTMWAVVVEVPFSLVELPSPALVA